MTEKGMQKEMKPTLVPCYLIAKEITEEWQNIYAEDK